MPNYQLSKEDQEVLNRMNERLENMTDEDRMKDRHCCEASKNWDGKEPTEEEILKCGESVLKAFKDIL